jgi:hypothetical protein
MKDLPVTTENGQRNFDNVEKKLKGIDVGKIVDVHLQPDTGGYLLMLAALSKKYAKVEPLLIGKSLSLFYCKEYKRGANIYAKRVT